MVGTEIDFPRGGAPVQFKENKFKRKTGKHILFNAKPYVKNIEKKKLTKVFL